MKREELNKKIKSVKKQIEKLESVEYPVYKTDSKYIEKFGIIKELETLDIVAKAFTFVKSNFQGFDNAYDELGIVTKETEKPKYMGYALDTWTTDFKIRVQQLNDFKKIKDLNNALEVLNKHRSEDDIFNEDMERISDILDFEEDED